MDGNWGVHSVIPKKIFEPISDSSGIEVDSDATAESRAGTSSLGEPDLTLSSDNVHWGFFSKELDPVLTVTSGQEVVVEMATHHACDDWDRMIAGDPGKKLVDYSGFFRGNRMMTSLAYTLYSTTRNGRHLPLESGEAK